MMNHPFATTDLTHETRRRRILLVDDHEVGRRSLCRLLEGMGFEVKSAKDGSEAIESLRTSLAPDYVLTDLRLPDLDGREVVQEASRLVPRPWIALITGWDLGENELKTLGIDCLFLKPLNIGEILARLEQAARSSVLVGQSVGNLGEERCSSP